MVDERARREAREDLEQRLADAQSMAETLSRAVEMYQVELTAARDARDPIEIRRVQRAYDETQAERQEAQNEAARLTGTLASLR